MNPIVQHFEHIKKFINDKKRLASAIKYYDIIFSKIEEVEVIELKGNYLHYVKSILDFSPQLKECYRNAMLLTIIGENKIKYVDGYILYPNTLAFPVEHAWCKMGKFYFDPTRQFIDSKYANINEEAFYMGKVYSKKDVMQHITKTNTYESMLMSEVWKEMKT